MHGDQSAELLAQARQIDQKVFPFRCRVESVTQERPGQFRGNCITRLRTGSRLVRHSICRIHKYDPVVQRKIDDRAQADRYCVGGEVGDACAYQQMSEGNVSSDGEKACGQVEFEQAFRRSLLGRSPQVKRSCQKKLCRTVTSTARAVANR